VQEPGGPTRTSPTSGASRSRIGVVLHDGDIAGDRNHAPGGCHRRPTRSSPALCDRRCAVCSREARKLSAAFCTRSRVSGGDLLATGDRDRVEDAAESFLAFPRTPGTAVGLTTPVNCGSRGNGHGLRGCRGRGQSTRVQVADQGDALSIRTGTEWPAPGYQRSSLLQSADSAGCAGSGFRRSDQLGPRSTQICGNLHSRGPAGPSASSARVPRCARGRAADPPNAQGWSSRYGQAGRYSRPEIRRSVAHDDQSAAVSGTW